MHQNYCLTPLSAIRKYYKAKPFSPLMFHGMLKHIPKGPTACCSTTHDVDVQRSDSQTEAMINQNDTGNRGDSRTSANKKSILSMLGRAVSFPIMFTVSFSFLAPCAFMQNIKRVDYWTTALLLTAVAVAGDLIVRQGPAGRSGNSVRYKGPDSDAETCPSPLELSTPKPRQERRNCIEKRSICRETTPAEDQLVALGTAGLGQHTTAHEHAHGSLSATHSLQQ